MQRALTSPDHQSEGSSRDAGAGQAAGRSAKHEASLRAPSLIERALRFRDRHGVGKLAARVADLLAIRALKYVALLEYHLQVCAGVVTWKVGRTVSEPRITEGNMRFANGRFAVFLIYQPHETPWYVVNALEALREASVNAILIFNHDLDDERLKYFQVLSCRIVVRDNVGLDIGGYKDGYFNAMKSENVERLLLLNDSTYFFATGLPELFERLMASDHDVSAPFENNQIHHHLQSFCLSLSRRMANHDAVRRFFGEYIPINSRRWAIHKGEVALSRVLMSEARGVEVLYTSEALASYRGPLPRSFEERPVDFLPLGLRLHYEWLRDKAGPADPPLLTVAGLTHHHSMVHTGGFLFRALLGCPLMKRDLVYREQFTSGDIRSILLEIGHEGHLDAILSDSRRKGSGEELRGLQRGRYVAGMI